MKGGVSGEEPSPEPRMGRIMRPQLNLQGPLQAMQSLAAGQNCGQSAKKKRPIVTRGGAACRRVPGLTRENTGFRLGRLHTSCVWPAILPCCLVGWVVTTRMPGGMSIGNLFINVLLLFPLFPKFLVLGCKVLLRLWWHRSMPEVLHLELACTPRHAKDIRSPKLLDT